MILNGKEEICKYIPQREPIIMVDKLYAIEAEKSETGLTISADNIFVKDGELRDGAIVEHMAQSGALHIGYEHVCRGEEVPIGLIGTINKLQINRLPKVNEEIRTTIAMEARVGDISLVSAITRVGDEIVAQAKLKVATPK